MKGFAERMKWRMAGLIDRLPGQCWSGLVDWVLADRRERREWYLRERLPWRPISGSVCREDLDRVGSCYCGKLRRGGGAP